MAIKEIILNDKLIKYSIIAKKNKNTYFRFLKDGTIKITKSRYQTEKDIINYMKENSEYFLQKLNKIELKQSVKEGIYMYHGVEYLMHYHNLKEVIFNHDDKIVYLPSKDVDHTGVIVRYFERIDILNELDIIYNKYINNPYVDIKKITIKSRHTTSRFGSCNAVRRTINFNANLIHYDIKYLEYVFLHEISHLTHQNHGKEFYTLLEKLCPNYKLIRKELKEIYR